MVYHITISRKALKFLEKINEPSYTKIKTAIYALKNEPRPHGYKQLNGRKAYRIRVNDYRIIYDVFDDKLLIDVIDLGHRKDVYE